MEPVRPFLDRVSSTLAAQIQSFDPEIAPYARYALTNQGKQIRPTLVALSGNAVGGQHEDQLITASVIIEMVHLATLVHDDVMDEASVRRSRPTMAARWGNGISILVGDCIFAQALHLAASFTTLDVCRAVAQSSKLVCSGEILQTHNRGNLQLGRAEYLKIVGMKTGELFALACDMGAALSDASPVVRSGLRQYGYALGTAYQLYDDCIDIFGSEATAGKSLGTDLASGKLTLPILIVLEQASGTDRARLEGMLGAWTPDQWPQMRDLLEKYDALVQSRAVVSQYLENAREFLAVLEPASRAKPLTLAAEFFAQQIETLGV
ncbi:MAG TPA: polyprenyl synthetase family protein [Methylomirabilota bacterium]|nr:polyprenyl synthetase family protein [Methylomirabilota bacterium]